ncbi:hypothetical protein SOASR032_03620 [Pragia fontium]|uniref:Uncharacterized protein n=1 Tax=Pragia fontium TaxID=82985 RepID=A0ABQ5LGD4_9GAMM|nr:hypothetical protein QQ39_08700 [Pragia fontium]GKX61793.1 hypothetical protein SOASR032_03620 [Pragia fontium]
MELEANDIDFNGIKYISLNINMNDDRAMAAKQSVLTKAPQAGFWKSDTFDFVVRESTLIITESIVFTVV